MVTDKISAPSATGELLELEKAHIDLSSLKTQMVIGALLILIVCAVTQWQLNTVASGYADEDAQHLKYVEAIFRGKIPRPDLAGPYPLFMCSLYLEQLPGSSYPATSQLVNLAIVFGSSLLVALIVLEITGLYGNRLGAAPAIWAGLLFAVHPAHGSPGMILSSRPELLAHLLFLAALWCYLRFRLLGERIYFRGSLFCFLLALVSGPFPEILTYPLVILLANFLLFGKPSRGVPGSPARHASVKVWSYMLVCVLMILIVEGAAVALAVANPHGLLHQYSSLLRPGQLNYMGFSKALSVALPLGIPEGTGNLIYALAGGYIGCFALQVVRVLMRGSRAGPILFSALGSIMLVIAITITEAMRQPEPQLVPAAISMLLAFAALPAVDAVSKRRARWLSAAGAIALLAVFVSWSALLPHEVNDLL